MSHTLICQPIGVKMVQIFFDRIRDRIRLEGFRSVHIRVRVFNIWHRIRIRILKSHIYDVDIKSYPIRHGWHYPYSNLNLDRNIKTNVISVISVRIWSIFIPTSGPRKKMLLCFLRCRTATNIRSISQINLVKVNQRHTTQQQTKTIRGWNLEGQ